ncbi:MAG: SGNH/GDSL hydrolase family protein [Thermoguttaceae bacterium]|jgi:lysophospholipase L1-like esterase
MHGWILTIGLVAVSAPSAASDTRPPWSADFAANPLAASWTVEPPSALGTAATWTGGEIRTRGPRWQSPKFAVQPSRYYRLAVRSKGQPPSMWAAVFFDAAGQPLTSDHYSGLDAAAQWTQQEFFFRARHDAATCQLWFHPLEPSDDELSLSRVEVRPATRPEAALWADRILAELPPLRFTLPANRCERLPRTMTALRAGRPLRVVMLGDSIVNDTGNSAWDVLLERLYPKARIEIITSVRGGTGCQYYRQENRVEQYVIRHKPDLLVIGGISNGFDVEAIRSVIQQVRRQISSEVLVLSDPLGVHGDPRAWPLMMIEPGKQGDEMRKRLAALGPYRLGLRDMAAEEAVEYFDMATIWDTSIAHCGKPYEYYLRDPVHANERGRQILARMLVGFFAPSGK